MITATFSDEDRGLLGAGVYTLPEAARLTGVPIASIRRWTLGYFFVHKGERRFSPPLVCPQLDPIDSVPAMSFRDLQELRFLHAFRSRGTSWQAIRLAHVHARQRVGHTHPFSTGRFRVAGREILTEVAQSADDRVLENIVANRLVFRSVITPYLQGLEFKNGMVVRWFPRRDRRIVLDPTKSYGQPVVVKGGVPTTVLARSYRAEKSFARVARWYDVDERSVRAAVEFERGLAA